MTSGNTIRKTSPFGKFGGSSYLEAANALRGKRQRKRIVAYVESYDDIFFWRTVLSEYENEQRYFEVMLPTRKKLSKGKKQAIMQMLSEGGGECLIACVDADYDYLMQGRTYASEMMLNSPYVFHTYAYAIESYQCYAPSLHNVCVSATLNDHNIFDFVGYITELSRTIYPLFVWQIWFYRNLQHHTFPMSDFNRIITISHFSVSQPEQSLDRLRNKVNMKLREFRKQYSSPRQIAEIDALDNELRSLGVVPETTYMHIQGHHLFDNIISELTDKVCKILRRERETEIRQKATHALQCQNELSSYNHSQADISEMIRKNTSFQRSPLYKRIFQDLDRLFN